MNKNLYSRYTKSKPSSRNKRHNDTLTNNFSAGWSSIINSERTSINHNCLNIMASKEDKISDTLSSARKQNLLLKDIRWILENK